MKKLKKLKMTVELEFDDAIMYGGDANHEGKKWFFKDVLLEPQEGCELILHSNEIGDELGVINVLEIFERLE